MFSPLAAQLLHHYNQSDQINPHSIIILPPWQPSSYIISTPLNKLPPLLHPFNRPCSPALTLFYPSEQSSPFLLHHFTPLAAQLLNHFINSEQIITTLNSFYPPCQHRSYFILHPLNNLLPHSYIILFHLAAQLLYYFTSALHKLLPYSYTMFSPMAAQLLQRFTPPV